MSLALVMTIGMAGYIFAAQRETSNGLGQESADDDEKRKADRTQAAKKFRQLERNFEGARAKVLGKADGKAKADPQAIADAWKGGLKPLRCYGTMKITKRKAHNPSGTEASRVVPAVIVGKGCKLTLVDCEISGPIAILVEEGGQVTVRGGKLTGRQAAIRVLAGGRATVRGASLSSLKYGADVQDGARLELYQTTLKLRQPQAGERKETEPAAIHIDRVYATQGKPSVHAELGMDGGSIDWEWAGVHAAKGGNAGGSAECRYQSEAPPDGQLPWGSPVCGGGRYGGGIWRMCRWEGFCHSGGGGTQGVLGRGQNPGTHRHRGQWCQG